MGLGSESKKNSNQQQKSKQLKEKSQLLQQNLGLKNQRKIKVKKAVEFSHGNLPGEQGQDQSHSSIVQTKSYGDRQGLPHKVKTTKEDELVKYMSNLPGYLLRIDSGENLQEKALNVGVLDWASLEKWKHHRKHDLAITGKYLSSTSTISSIKTNTKPSALSSAVPKDAAAYKSKQHPATCSSLKLSHKAGLPRGAKSSAQKVRHFKDIETAPKSTLDQQKKTSKTYKSSGTAYPDFGKGEKKDLNKKTTSGMGNMPSSMINYGVSTLPKETMSIFYGGSRNMVEQRQNLDVNKEDLDQKNTLDLEASPSKFRNYAALLASEKTLSAESEKTRKKENRGSEIGPSHQLSSCGRKNILLPPRSARHSFCEEPQELYDGTLNNANRNSFSYDFLQTTRFGKQVPHSCPLPSGVEMNCEATFISQGLKPASNASHGSACSNISGRSEGKCFAENEIKSQDADGESPKIPEEEMAELASNKSRIASPNRRFSFSLSRMGRSFSFKESSSIPQLSSTYVSVKSGPVRTDSSSLLDDTNSENANSHHRTRSSPLRRMLDPLLKSRGLNSFRFSDTVQPSKGSLPSFAGPITFDESLQKEKFEPSMIQALLQLTMNGGVPLFRFVADGSNMLATKMKSLASPAKGESDENYIFSSVSEIKKKGGRWINQGNREKNQGYMYNIIGQMKISNSYPSDLTVLDSCNQDFVKECVLFGVEQRKADQASTMFIPSTELAAVVVKMHFECTSVRKDDKDITEKGFAECLAVDGCSFNSVENATNNTTVILPGGIHSLPNKGIPSPLIDRWKSGGLCDCGGWDVGCKLRILCNQNSRCCKISRTCQACLNPNRLELYAQEEALASGPIFRMVPHKKGIYAIEFGSSITALQAFFISVTVISCQKSSDLLPEGNVIKETVLNDSHGMENKPTIVPPHSPVGRA